MAGCVYTKEQRREIAVGIPLNDMRSPAPSALVLRKDMFVAAVDAPSTIRLIQYEMARTQMTPQSQMKLDYDEDNSFSNKTSFMKFDPDEIISDSERSSSAKFDADDIPQVATTSKPTTEEK